jgi:TRAP-type C4-dicarboxylate transport system permease small subunit
VTDTSGEDRPAPAGLPEPEPDAVVMIRNVNKWIGLAEVGLLCAFLTLLIGTATYNLIANHVFDKNPTWTDELIRYSVFFVAWTGATLAAQTDQMLSMDLIAKVVKPRTKLMVRLFTGCFTLTACALLTWGGWKLRAEVSGEDYEVLSKGTVALAFPLGAAMIGLHTAMHMAIDAIYLAKRRLPPAAAHQQLH